MTEQAARDPHAMLAALVRDEISLQLGTFDLCCLAGLYMRAERESLASFPEEQLLDLFDQVCEVVHPEVEHPRARTTHAIGRLRQQALLARLDGVGVVQAGEYTLTRLAAAIVESLLENEALTRQSLTLLTGTLIAQLAEVKAAAVRAQSGEDWSEGVIAPLRVTVGDLVAGIERRQRGLDDAQTQVQAKIAALLQSDWFEAIEETQELLDRTTDTLRELNEVLLRDTGQFMNLLQDISQLAQAAEALAAQQAAQRVVEQVERLNVWGNARQLAWSNYYQYVHRYLRDVVRLDPDRALSRRLQRQLVAWSERPFYLNVVSTPSFLHMREVEVARVGAQVTAAHMDRERPIELLEEEDGVDLEPLVSQALSQGADSLSAITAFVLSEIAPAQRFLVAGKVAAIVARITRARSERERDWVRAHASLEIQDWSVLAQEDSQEAG